LQHSLEEETEKSEPSKRSPLANAAKGFSPLSRNARNQENININQKGERVTTLGEFQVLKLISRVLAQRGNEKLSCFTQGDIYTLLIIPEM